MRTPNEIRADINLEVAPEGGSERLEELLTELVFASRLLALKTSADAMRRLGEESDDFHAHGWHRAADWLQS